MWAQSAIVPVFMQDATAGFEWVVGSPDPAAGVVPGGGVEDVVPEDVEIAMQVDEPFVRMTSFIGLVVPSPHFITPAASTCRTGGSQAYCSHS